MVLILFVVTKFVCNAIFENNMSSI